MKLTKWMTMAVAAMALTGTVLAQDAGGNRGNRGNRGQRDAGGDQAGQGGMRGGNFTPEQRQQFMQQMQQRMNERIKESLKVTDEEWTAIEPLVNEVNKQRMASFRSGRGGPGGFGGRGGRGGPGGDQAGQENQDPATTALQKVLESANSTDAQIKAAVEAYRASQAKSKEAMKKAQDELRAVLTSRQEAQLILMGILE